MIFSGPLIVSFLVKHWRSLVGASLIILLALFAGSWLMQRSKIERLKIENGSLELRIENIEQVCDEVIHGLEKVIDEVAEEQDAEIRAAAIRESQLQEELAAVTEEADRQHARAVLAESETRAAIKDAGTSEEKVDIFLGAMAEVIK